MGLFGVGARQLPTLERVAVIGAVVTSSRSTLKWRLLSSVVVCRRELRVRGALDADIELSDDDEDADEGADRFDELEEVGEEEEEDGDPFEDEPYCWPVDIVSAFITTCAFASCLLLASMFLADRHPSVGAFTSSIWGST